MPDHVFLGLGLGPAEIAIAAGVIVLLFGARKLPALARSMGSSITEFKKGLKGEDGAQITDGTDRDDETASDKS